MRALLLFFAVEVLLVSAVIVACGSSRPPSAVVDVSGPDGEASHDDAAPATFGDAEGDPYYDCEPSEAGPGRCPCRVHDFGGISEIPCGVSVCSDLKQESAYCTADGHLVIVSGQVFPYCTNDAGADGANAVRPCDAGTLPKPPR